jgi:hypothetical protein
MEPSAQEIAHLADLIVLVGDRRERLVPKGRRLDRHHVAPEFGQVGRRRHSLPERRDVLVRGMAPHAHDADHERHPRGVEILPDVADEVGEPS